jgi:DNA-binding ferritin-like protein
LLTIEKTETKNSAFDTFWGTLRSINPENRPHIEVKTEPYILREANDISEEITIIDRIYDQQRRVVDDFAKYLSMNDPKANKTPFESEVLSAIQEIRNKLSVVDNLRVSTRLQGEDHTQTIPQTTTEDRTLKTGVHVPDSTLRNAKQTIESILQRKGQVQELQRTALEISDQVDSHLSYFDTFSKSLFSSC